MKQKEFLFILSVTIFTRCYQKKVSQLNIESKTEPEQIEFYIPVLENMVTSQLLDETEKTRSQDRLIQELNRLSTLTYNQKAIPTLYLPDKDKLVLLKDVAFQSIESRFVKRNTDNASDIR